MSVADGLRRHDDRYTFHDDAVDKVNAMMDAEHVRVGASMWGGNPFVLEYEQVEP